MQKKLRIGIIAPIWYTIPPDMYGGTERIVYHLVEGLVKKGHRVTLFAAGDAKTSARLIPTAPRSLRKDGYGWNEYGLPLLNIYKAIERSSKFDIIHSHVDEFALFFSKLIRTPMVSTAHNPFDRRFYYRNNKRFTYSRLQVYDHFYPHPIISISDAQKRVAKILGNFVGTVYNGIDVSMYRYNPNPQNHVVWISRFGGHKGPVEAIKAARLAGVKLVMAGHLDRENMSFFNKEIKPLPGRGKTEYIGELDQKSKNAFFGSAKALLYPANWEEPFGLVMVEAMSCGTPVVAFGRGAVPEIVKDRKTGFVVKTVEGMARAIKKIGFIRREDCREHVEKNFTIQKMVDDYEAMYYKLVARYGKKK